MNPAPLENLRIQYLKEIECVLLGMSKKTLDECYWGCLSRTSPVFSPEVEEATEQTEARDADGAAPSSVSDPGMVEQHGLLGSGLLGRLSIFSMSHTGWDCGGRGNSSPVNNPNRMNP